MIEKSGSEEAIRAARSLLTVRIVEDTSSTVRQMTLERCFTDTPWSVNGRAEKSARGKQSLNTESVFRTYSI